MVFHPETGDLVALIKMYEPAYGDLLQEEE
jgi:hypothetical protein